MIKATSKIQKGEYNNTLLNKKISCCTVLYVAQAVWQSTVLIWPPFPPLMSLLFLKTYWNYCYNCSGNNLCAILWAVLTFQNAFSWTHISQHQSAIWGHKMNWLAWWLVISMLIISNSHILFILSQTCFSPSAEIVYTSHFIFLL